MSSLLGTVSLLFRYPVKSMGGESLDDSAVNLDGLVGDRVWALRDVETGKLVSAKRPRLWRSMLECGASGVGDDVSVQLPDGTFLSIVDPETSRVLSRFLGREVTVERAETTMQGVYASDWPEIEGVSLQRDFDAPTNLTGRGRSFADVEPLHILTTSSLNALNAADPDIVVDVRRFRPNIVISTPENEGFVENDWEGLELTAGEVVIKIIDPTARCIMTTVQQGELPQQKGILQTLARINRVKYKLGTMAAFGANATVLKEGQLILGDQLHKR